MENITREMIEEQKIDHYTVAKYRDKELHKLRKEAWDLSDKLHRTRTMKSRVRWAKELCAIRKKIWSERSFADFFCSDFYLLPDECEIGVYELLKLIGLAKEEVK